MQIHQLVVGASMHDAVGELALELQIFLSEIGPSEIFSHHCEPNLTARVRNLEDLRSKFGSSEDIIIYHVTIGDDEIIDLLDKRPERVAIIYHNITPSHFFYPFDPVFANLLDLGRRQLKHLAPRVCGVLAVSKYNAQELLNLGYQNIALAPPLVSLEKILNATDEPTAHHLKILSQKSPIVLYVGQLLPHKRPDFIIEAFNILATSIIPEAQLIMVGTGRLPNYRSAIEELISQTNLGSIWLTGQVGLGQLAEFYRGSDILAISSEHEGFCLPLVEAMAFEKPVLARDYAAIPETLGQGGVILPKNSTAAEFAEAMAMVLENKSLSESIVGKQNERRKDFSVKKARTSFFRWLMELI